MPNRNGTQGTGDSYRYGFQGQEQDDEVKGKGNSINYKYRMHDPRIGRFFAVDPLAHKFPYLTPYQFSSNTPIVAVELEGLETSIELNYNQASIEITRDNSGRLTVTRKQLQTIKGHYQGATSQSYSMKDLSPGGMYDLPCTDCGSKFAPEIQVRIFLPKLTAPRKIMVPGMVPEIVKGDPPTEGHYDKKTATVGREWRLGSADGAAIYTTPILLTNRIPIFKIGLVIRKDAETDKNFDGLVSIKILVSGFIPQSDFQNIVDMVQPSFGVPVSIETDPSLAGAEIAVDVKYLKKLWVPGTDGTPDTTIMVPGMVEEEIEVDPVVINP